MFCLPPRFNFFYVYTRALPPPSNSVARGKENFYPYFYCVLFVRGRKCLFFSFRRLKPAGGGGTDGGGNFVFAASG